MAKAAERPRWRVNETSFIGHSLVQEGDEVNYNPTSDPKTGITDGVSSNLSPLNDEAQEIVDEQKRDHPDKTVNEGQRAREQARLAAELEESEADRTGALRPKGDKRTRKGRGAAAAAAAAEPKPDDDDIA